MDNPYRQAQEHYADFIQSLTDDKKAKEAKRAAEVARVEDLYEQGVIKGKDRFEEDMGQEAFNQAWETQRSQAQKDRLDRLRDQSRGLNAQENAAARGQFESAIRRSGATQRNALMANLAGRGMSGGGYAASQRAALESNLANQLIGAERQLLLDNVEAKNRGLAAYGDVLDSQEGNIYNWLADRSAFGDSLGRQAVDLDAAAQQRELERQKIKASRRRFLGIF